MEPGWLEAHLDRSDGFARARWSTISPLLLDSVPESGLHEAFTGAAREWLLALSTDLGAEYGVSESDNFLVLSRFSQRHVQLAHTAMEQMRHALLVKVLPGVAREFGYGKHVVLHLHDVERYYGYVAPFFPEQGEFAANGGVCLTHSHEGAAYAYAHFATYGSDFAEFESTIAHELTHVLLCTLDIPMWLNEGLATHAQNVLSTRRAMFFEAGDIALHRRTWSDDGIQTFWTGTAYHNPDGRQRLAYSLAHMAVQTLIGDYDALREFTLNAKQADAGDAAARAVYGRGVGELIEHLLGPGAWTPDPQKWRTEPQSPGVDRTEPQVGES
jgi:hypothetical protein